MKKIIILFLSLMFFVSCFDGEESCPAFDFTSSHMEWFLFPEDKDAYSFTSSTGQLMSFNKQQYEATEKYIIEDIRCFSSYNESCSIKLETEYFSEDLGIHIKNSMLQNNDLTSEEMYIDLDRDSPSKGFTTYITSHSLEEGEGAEVVFINSIEIGGELYKDVLSFSFEDDSGSVYISKGNGIVGLIIEGETYSIQ